MPSTRMGCPVISSGMGMPKKSRIVGATSTLATSPECLVVSDRKARGDPEAAKALKFVP